ncbi:MAG: hypothetical protein RSB16_00420, partial [Raoultibacter sp.]
ETSCTLKDYRRPFNPGDTTQRLASYRARCGYVPAPLRVQHSIVYIPDIHTIIALHGRVKDEVEVISV